MIDFDDTTTFPSVIKQWVLEHERYFKSTLSKKKFNIWWELEHELADMRLWEKDFVKQYIEENDSIEIAVWHAARIENETSYKENGIVVMDGPGSKAEQHLLELFWRIGLNTNQINQILEGVHFLWDRDYDTRTNMIHFFVDKNLVYRKDAVMCQFALNLGGECVRWAIESIDKDLFRSEPYKRLWILGKPSIIKFKCRLGEMECRTKERLIAEIVKYYVVKELFGFMYEFDFTGMKVGKVYPEDIITIEEIENFIEVQERNEEYKDFYSELKN